jgi:two-component system sensor histidine kinase ChvG
MDTRPDMAHAMRTAADETAHALKGSLATIQSSIEPLRRAVPEDDRRARRAIELIEAALGRLNDLVEAAHRRDCAVAATLEKRLAAD